MRTTKILFITATTVALIVIGYIVFSSQSEEAARTSPSAVQTASVENTSDTATSQPYLNKEELVQVTTTDEVLESKDTTKQVKPTGVKYVEVQQSCDHAWKGDCIAAYNQASHSAATTTRLRKDMVLRVDGMVSNEGKDWYRLEFDDQKLHYPERVKSDWFVAADQVVVLYAPGILTSWEDEAPTSTEKRIVIDKSDQKLYAYEGEALFLETTISTGLELSPTTEGTFEVFKKTPSRYMQGPLEGVPGSDYYDLPGVPWNLYFTEAGEVIHGAYWHDSFGKRYSHGCVNLPSENAQKLYRWTPLNTSVTVQK